MQAISTSARRYDTTTIVFHWVTAGLVLTQWFGAQTIDWFPRGALRVDARSVHITLGVVLGIVLAARLIWRSTEGRRLPAADTGFLHIVAKATHWALYTLVGAMVLVGLFLAWTRGDSIFNLFSIPAWKPGDHGLADQVQEVHATIGWLILALVGVHAGAGLVHRFLWKDGVLDRMLPQGWRGPA